MRTNTIHKKEGDCTVDACFFVKAFQEPCLATTAGVEQILLNDTVPLNLLTSSFESGDDYGKENFTDHCSDDRSVSH